MEDFMHEDARELLGVGGQFRVERDAPFADERAGVDWAAAVGEFAADLQPDRPPVDVWEARTGGFVQCLLGCRHFAGTLPNLLE
jgi:hypothetical protein